MNIVILSGSPRKGGNTDLLVKAFAEEASQRHNVETIAVRDHKVNPYIGCNSCFKNPTNKCCQNDDMAEIYQKLGKADMLVIASPVYFYSISAQLKAVIDRLHNPVRDSFNIKKLALLLTGAASLPELFDAILTEYRLCLNFFKLEDAGMVLVRGAQGKGDVANTGAVDEARELGKRV